ncbi:helix-turn-helix domain-containing protein [Shinella granuli]|uniref:helix-turn-helix domain-containing protein n=1 Tax=Shinella granuli TaxID=323621 RepID=UPI0013C3021A|nr:helix-turn-helix domain-containing protein [Shinella granuli]
MKREQGKSRDGEVSFAEYRGRWIECGLEERDLTDGAFRVLAGLAYFFLNREKRVCWPSQDAISKKLRMPRRTVQKHLAELQARGLVLAKRQGREKPNVYIPAFPDAREAADYEAQNSAHHKGAMKRKNRGDDAPNSASMMRSELRSNPLKEPVDEPGRGDSPYQGAVPLNNGRKRSSDRPLTKQQFVMAVQHLRDSLRAPQIAIDLVIGRFETVGITQGMMNVICDYALKGELQKLYVLLNQRKA